MCCCMEDVICSPPFPVMPPLMLLLVPSMWPVVFVVDVIVADNGDG